FQGVQGSGSADSHYYDWVDQFDTLGLGENTPIITGNSSDSLLALVNGKFVILRVPYPLGFFAKAWTGVSTIRMRDGKAKVSGRRGERAPRFTAKPAREQPVRLFISRYDRIRSPTSSDSETVGDLFGEEGSSSARIYLFSRLPFFSLVGGTIPFSRMYVAILP